MNDSQKAEITSEIARPEDVLPAVLHLLPLEKKPFFPGQVLPVVLDVSRWGKTLKTVHEAGHGTIGVVFTDGVAVDRVEWKHFRSVGTVCKIHQIEQHEKQYHVVLAGMQRFEITGWVSRDRPFSAQVGYFPELNPRETTEIKAYTTAIVNTIKELLPLNPMYGEELKMFLNYFGTCLLYTSPSPRDA